VFIALTACGAMAEAQPLTKVSRIGYLQVTPSASVVARTEAFRQDLRELGYVEGQNILIEWRFAEGKADRLSFLAAELARLNVDVIVTSGPTVTRSAHKQLLRFPLS
jgi:putative ABC transport system substrate-binding protein